MSGPCAVYNFYNCCNGSEGNANQSGTGCDGGDNTSFGNAVFPWTSGSILEPHNSDFPNFDDAETLTPVLSIPNWVGTDGLAYMGLTPYHRITKLLELSALKLPLPTGYIGSAILDIVVLDYAGAVLRTISNGTIDLVTIPDQTWIPITLTATSADLDITPSEVIAGRLIMDTSNSPNTIVRYHLSGSGIFL